MKAFGKRNLLAGLILILAFALFTWLVQTVDVKPLGVNGSDIGFAALNVRVHAVCGVHRTLYTITDWAGLVPIFVVLAFGCMGLAQLLKRKSLWKVDTDILLLGGYYLVVAALYVLFEEIPINYRPVLINGVMEVSYPSSTTLLVMAVMPTLTEQLGRRCGNRTIIISVNSLTIGFMGVMVLGRLLSGVHWVTDIFGAVLISMGLFYSYRGIAAMMDKRI